MENRLGSGAGTASERLMEFKEVAGPAKAAVIQALKYLS
jgi:hypothetical protein